jgi:hypothetical protein
MLLAICFISAFTARSCFALAFELLILKDGGAEAYVLFFMKLGIRWSHLDGHSSHSDENCYVSFSTLAYS